MTLIQTLVTPDHILQVSDRRLTRGDGTVFDDSHNKAVSWCGEMAIGFTGIAFIDRAQRKPVSEWIAETLCDVSDVEEGVEKLRRGAEEAVGRLPISWPDKRLTMVMTGFFDGTDGTRHSVSYRISNFERGEETFPSHQPEFFRTIYHYPERPGCTYYVRAGALLNSWHRRVVHNRIFEVALNPNEINRVMRLMVALQRHVSRQNKTVGQDAMVMYLPKNPVTRGAILTDISSSGLTTKTASFSYIAHEGFTPERFGPHWVCGGSAFADFEGGQIGPNRSDQSVTIRILKVPPGPVDPIQEKAPE
ncbi:hypothetical protein [Nocardia carnea]|uniref:hypothetical protein n=1 Tax=Nocardia carnea TaxID=37328 RepID=UPI002458D8A6|nr:hypothetical protein [Nocardia carnea]